MLSSSGGGDLFKAVQDSVCFSTTKLAAENHHLDNNARYQMDKAVFFGDDKPKNEVVGLGARAKTTKPCERNINNNLMKQSGLYRKDRAAFFDDQKFEVSSQGTQFQHNAAAFMGIAKMPKSGERPFKLDKIAKNCKATERKVSATPSSYLNEQRLKQHEINMQRDPNFKKNVKRFHGLPSAMTRSSCHQASSKVNKLDAFI